MGTVIILPQITALRLKGFSQTFNQSIEWSLNPGPNLILGGNALGKTTLMQVIIYGLTGGVSVKIEKDKTQRWDRKYFQEILPKDQVKSASIEIDFKFRKMAYSIRRGFSHSDVQAFRELTASEWTQEKKKANVEFEKAVTFVGGYPSTEDFNFVVYRLLYLPETRQLLAWDADAQLRLLMLLSPDIESEKRFRDARIELKRTDSLRRHAHVAYTNVTKFFREQDLIDEEVLTTKRQTRKKTKRQLPVITEILKKTADERMQLEKVATQLAKDLSTRSVEIDSLRQQIDAHEVTLINHSLRQTEKSWELPIQKLVDRGICPCCGMTQHELQLLAEKYVREQRCALCGSEHLLSHDPQFREFQSQLAEKLLAQQTLDDQHRSVRVQIHNLRQKEDELQIEIEKLRNQTPTSALAERKDVIPLLMGNEDRETVIDELETRESNFQALYQQRRQLLETSFAEYRESIQARLTTFRQLYEEYATAYLGFKCELEELPAVDRLMSFTRFVPKFDGRVILTPRKCSEAQRFFLDIAFRMALIDLATKLADAPSMFMCETPESALDLSYIDNVTNMFTQFSGKGHTLVFTSNIQSDGIAMKLLGPIPQEIRPSRVLNLLNFSRLSDVQEQAIRKLRNTAKKISG